jgi:hypothetical protein
LYDILRDLQDASAVGGGGDKRAQLGIKAALAKALCMTSNKEEGMSLFRETIEIERAHVGPSHHNLVGKYYNAALCAVQMDLIREASAYVKSMAIVCDHNSHVPLVVETCAMLPGLRNQLDAKKRIKGEL